MLLDYKEHKWKEWLGWGTGWIVTPIYITPEKAWRITMPQSDDYVVVPEEVYRAWWIEYNTSP